MFQVFLLYFSWQIEITEFGPSFHFSATEKKKLRKKIPGYLISLFTYNAVVWLRHSAWRVFNLKLRYLKEKTALTFLLSSISSLFQCKREVHLTSYVLSFGFIEISVVRNFVNLNIYLITKGFFQKIQPFFLVVNKTDQNNSVISTYYCI